MGSPEQSPLSARFSHAPPEGQPANEPVPPEEDSVTKDSPPGALPEVPDNRTISPSQFDKLDGWRDDSYD